ncbi:MAG TPA: hypothetical protein VF062_05825 [Candidatus Limnocylindrales bacterium]
MSLLHTILRDRNIDGIRQASLAIGAVIFSGLNIAVLGVLEPRGLWQIVPAVIISALSLAVLVRGIQRLLLVSWARPVLGQWVYISSSGNWGLADIGIRGGEFTYSVQLYRTEQDTMAAVRQEPGFVSRCFATVTSAGVTYEKGQVELVYKISNAEEGYAPRSGMLTLSPLSPTAMKGYWKSDIMGEEASRGVLNMWRPEADGSAGSATA